MKIATITFHDTFNFGATLQCVALSKYLSSKGHSVLVIHYLPDYVLQKKSPFRAFSDIHKQNGAKRKFQYLFPAVYYFTHFFSFRRRDKRYHAFLSQHINLTEPASDFEHIKPLDADLYLCGSDQIWNPALTGGSFDKAFFLAFTNGRKAAYGISTGEADLFALSSSLRELTLEFSHISVREEKTADAFKQILNREIEVVLDPALLLDQDDYREMEKAIPVKGPYVLIYNVSRAPAANAIASRIAAEKGLKIIDISPSPFVLVPGAKKIDDIGPGEFLSYMKNAAFIVTNSFHGTVFSILYQKCFFSVPNGRRSGRIVALLQMLGLKDRFTRYPALVSYEAIRYDEVYEKLNLARKNSYEYLKMCCEENRNQENLSEQLPLHELSK